MNTYYKYAPIIYNRKTLKELYRLNTIVTLTEQEAINMQIQLSTPEKIHMLEKITVKS